MVEGSFASIFKRRSRSPSQSRTLFSGSKWRIISCKSIITLVIILEIYNRIDIHCCSHEKCVLPTHRPGHWCQLPGLSSRSESEVAHSLSASVDSKDFHHGISPQFITFNGAYGYVGYLSCCSSSLRVLKRYYCKSWTVKFQFDCIPPDCLRVVDTCQEFQLVKVRCFVAKWASCHSSLVAMIIL